MYIMNQLPAHWNSAGFLSACKRFFGQRRGVRIRFTMLLDIAKCAEDSITKNADPSFRSAIWLSR